MRLSLLIPATLLALGFPPLLLGQTEILPAPLPRVAPAPGQPALGITTKSLTREEAIRRQLPVSSGALVVAVAADSPADRAGLPVGAVIVAFDGRRIDDSPQLVQAVRAPRTDSSVEVAYYQGDRLYRRRVQLAPVVAAGVDESPVPASETPRTNSQPRAERRPSLLEQQLSDQGRRPILGRVGRILDELVVPADGELDLPDTRPHADEVTLLRQQVAALQRQVDELQQRLQALERRLGERRDLP